MEINTDLKTKLKILMALRQMSLQDLACKLTEATGKPYSRHKIYGKIKRDTISFTEIETIAKILGYRIEFVEEKL